jgi:hypothetical protein
MLAAIFSSVQETAGSARFVSRSFLSDDGLAYRMLNTGPPCI